MKKWMVTALVCVALVAVVIVGAAGCATRKKTTTPASSAMPSVATPTGKLRVGMDATYRPYEFSEGGNIVGFDVDLSGELAKHMGLSVAIVPTGWDELIPGLNNGNYDILMSAMTVTPERLALIDFTGPYMDQNESVAVLASSPIKTKADLTGKTLGVLTDTTGQYLAQTIPGAVVRQFDNPDQMFAALQGGSIEGVVEEIATNQYLCSHVYTAAVVSVVIPTHEQLGIGVKKGNSGLLAQLNKALAATKADGTYAALYQKWFGAKP